MLERLEERDTPSGLAPTLVNPGAKTNAPGDYVGFLIGRSDPENDPLTFSASGLPAGLSLDPYFGQIFGQIASGSPSGTNPVTITVNDGTSSVSETFDWTISGTNHAPQITTPLPGTNFNTGDAVNLTIPATDIDGNSLTFTASGLPAGLTMSTGGQITGTITAPAGNYTSTVQVTDGQLSDYATLDWTIGNPGSPTVIAEDDSATVENLSTVDIAVRANDTGGDYITVIAYPAHGWLSINGDVVTYDPEDTYTGSDTFSYTLFDMSTGANDSAVVTINVSESENQPPLALDDTRTAYESALEIDVLINDDDPEGGQLTILNVGSATYGTVSITGATITYLPNAGTVGQTDTFSYTIADVANATATAIVTVALANAQNRPLLDWANAVRGEAYNQAGFGPGRLYSVPLRGDMNPVTVWRPDNGVEGAARYWCHGFTFGGSAAAGGPFSIFSGPDIDRILTRGAVAVPADQAQVGDIVVFRTITGDIDHSARITQVVLAGAVLGGTTRLDSKNGNAAFGNFSLAELQMTYPLRTINVYRLTP